MDVGHFRAALGAHMGQVLTPAIAVLLEQAAAHTPDHSIDPLQFAVDRHITVTFQVERLTDILPELHRLHAEHYKETELAVRGVPMNPDYDTMRAAERSGSLLQVTARDVKTRELVGNIRLYVYDSTHTKKRCAREDTYFLLPAYRHGWTALRFWRYAENCLRQLGTTEVSTDAKLSNDVSKINTFMGYTHVSNRFLKILKD